MFLMGIIIFLVAVNMLMLDVIVFSRGITRVPQEALPDNQILLPTRSLRPTNASREECSPACKTYIDEKTANLSSPSKTSVVESAPVVASPKEFYIPLGTGSTKSPDWQDVLSAEAYIDTAGYPSIKEVTFEVFMHIPTANGRMYAKLFNVTDKHDVWFSEVFMEGNTVTRKEAKITLEPGKKQYRVMLKSTLRYDALLDNARIKIVTY